MNIKVIGKMNNRGFLKYRRHRNDVKRFNIQLFLLWSYVTLLTLVVAFVPRPVIASELSPRELTMQMLSSMPNMIPSKKYDVRIVGEPQSYSITFINGGFPAVRDRCNHPRAFACTLFGYLIIMPKGLSRDVKEFLIRHEKAHILGWRH